MIAIRIDLTKIPKEKIFSGKKGEYIDLIVASKREEDQYGKTHSVFVSQTKEERQSNTKTVYVGDGKELGQGNNNRKSQPANQNNNNLEDLPF